MTAVHHPAGPDPSPERPPVLVAGGGIGGLAATRALQLAGLPVHLLERDREPRATGSGLSIWSNGMASLRALGLDRSFRDEVATPIQRSRLVNRAGRDLSALDPTRLPKNYPTPHMVLRAEMHAWLSRHVAPERATTSAEVVAVHEDGPATERRVRVTTANGEEHEGSALIGVDGVFSKVRRAVGGPSELREWQVAWLGHGPETLLPPDMLARGHLLHALGAGRQLIVGRLADGRVFYFASVSQRLVPAARADRDHACLLRLFRRFAAPLRAMLADTPRDHLVVTTLRDIPQAAPRWGRGRVTLLGDAAHPVAAYLGQGACLALEDAAALRRLLVEGGPVATTLRRYEAERGPRRSDVCRQAARHGMIAGLSAQALRPLRDLAFWAVPERVLLERHRLIVAPGVK